MALQKISPDFPFQKTLVHVLDSSMAYADTGSSNNISPTVVFVHGNPTSSYLWRNIIPHVSPIARCIAPDLVGFGDSGKMPSNGYHVREHTRYFEAFMDAVISAKERVVLVVHDWGSAIGFDWARKHEERVAGLVFMEFVYGSSKPEDFVGWDHFQKFRTEGLGRQLIIEQNMFVEVVLGQVGTVRRLTEAEMEHYRRPFLDPIDREPTWRFPNEIPYEGFAPDVLEMVKHFWMWLRGSGQNKIPKLMFWAEPGMLLPPNKVKDVAEWMDNVKVVGIGPGGHFLQEDNPHLIGTETRKFIEDIIKAK